MKRERIPCKELYNGAIVRLFCFNTEIGGGGVGLGLVGLILSRCLLFSEFLDFPLNRVNNFFEPVVGNEKISAGGLFPFMFCLHFMFSIYKVFSLDD
jgi:hypothetical protein